MAAEEMEFEYEDTPWDSGSECEVDEDQDAAPAAPPVQPATGSLRDGRRFAVVFCSPNIGTLTFWAEAQEMLDAGVLSAEANLSQGATPEAVDQLMRDFDPHILWFVGHGNASLSGEITLMWTTPNGGFVLVDPRTCCDMLAKYTPQRGGSLECVVLNACQTMREGSTLGLLLHEAGVPFVAGWISNVADAAAPFFSRGFLCALQGGMLYAEAYERGRQEVTKQREGPHPSLLVLKTASNQFIGKGETQRFELIDPEAAQVVSRGEVSAPHGTLHSMWLFRTRAGQTGEGRLAAGVPDQREHLPPEPFSVPLLPANHLPRPDVVGAVLQQLCVPRPAAPGVLVAASILGVHGMGGMGKTVLCQLVCKSPRVRYRFPGGIFWLTISEEPDILQLQTRLRDHLRNYDSAARVLQNTSEGRDELRHLLRDKTCLVVLDDVWKRQHGEELIGGCVAGFSQILISTRNADQFTVSTPIVSLDKLDDANARHLLLLSSGLIENSWTMLNAADVAALVRRSCGLPLALCILGALVDGDAQQLHRLASREPELQLSSEQLNMPYAHQSVMECIEMSMSALPDNTRQQLLDLALYPEDAVVPVQALAIRWCHELDFASDDAADCVRGVLRLLRKRTLVMLEGDTFYLHDLVREYLRKRVGESGLRSAQVALLALYRERSVVPGVWQSLPRDGYVHDHLLYHITQAQRGAPLEHCSLLQELQPLQHISSEACVDFRTQTRQLRKHALLSTRAEHDTQRWQHLMTSEDAEKRYEAVGLTLALGLRLLPDALEQLQSRIIDGNEKVAARAIEIGEIIHPGMLQDHAKTLLHKFRHTSQHSEQTRTAALNAIGKLQQPSVDIVEQLANVLTGERSESLLGIGLEICSRAAKIAELTKATCVALENIAAAVACSKIGDTDANVRAAALYRLRQLEPWVLVRHASAVFAKLEDANCFVRSAAVETLGMLEPAVLAQHAAAVVAKLEDADKCVRRAAEETLGMLEPAVLAQHAAAFITLLEHADGGVRWSALKTLGVLEPAALAEHAAAVVAKLEDADKNVRKAVLEALAKLEPAALAEHAAAVVAKLAHANRDVREAVLQTLAKLEPAALAQHAAAIVAKLTDKERDVREPAWKALGKLGAEGVLAQHADAEDVDDVSWLASKALAKLPASVALGMLEDGNWKVRQVALETLLKLEPLVLAKHVEAFRTFLEDTEVKLQIAARFVMHKIEPNAGHMDAAAAKLNDSDPEGCYSAGSIEKVAVWNDRSLFGNLAAVRIKRFPKRFPKKGDRVVLLDVDGRGPLKSSGGSVANIPAGAEGLIVDDTTALGGLPINSNRSQLRYVIKFDSGQRAAFFAADALRITAVGASAALGMLETGLLDQPGNAATLK